jgi:hypothetical protein
MERELREARARLFIPRFEPVKENSQWALCESLSFSISNERYKSTLSLVLHSHCEDKSFRVKSLSGLGTELEIIIVHRGRNFGHGFVVEPELGNKKGKNFHFCTCSFLKRSFAQAYDTALIICRGRSNSDRGPVLEEHR